MGESTEMHDYWLKLTDKMARRKQTLKNIYLDFSDESVDEPILKAVADAVTSAGTLSHQIAIDIGGTTFYLYAYTTGS